MKEAAIPPPVEGLEAEYTLYEQASDLFEFDFKFTKKQRKAIIKRDNGRCNFPSDEGHSGSLHVHHLIPKSLKETTGIEVDHPLNSLTVCQGHHDVIHDRYGNGNGRAYTTTNGAVIWDAEWDAEMAARAIYNTREAIRNGWRFPDGE